MAEDRLILALPVPAVMRRPRLPLLSQRNLWRLDHRRRINTLRQRTAVAAGRSAGAQSTLCGLQDGPLAAQPRRGRQCVGRYDCYDFYQAARRLKLHLADSVSSHGQARASNPAINGISRHYVTSLGRCTRPLFCKKWNRLCPVLYMLLWVPSAQWRIACYELSFTGGKPAGSANRTNEKFIAPHNRLPTADFRDQHCHGFQLVLILAQRRMGHQ